MIRLQYSVNHAYTNPEPNRDGVLDSIANKSLILKVH